VTVVAPGAGTPSSPRGSFRHEAFLYRGEDEFADGVLGYVREGLEDDEAVLVAAPPGRLERLRDGLGPAADGVRWVDVTRAGTNPGRLPGLWAAALGEAAEVGRTLRGVGEPVWPGRRPQELAECHLSELLLGRAFAGGTGWRLMCPYDEAALPADVLGRVHRSHPGWTSPAARGVTGTTAEDLDAELAAACRAPLPPPPGSVLRGGFGAADVPAVRHTVVSWARSCRLAADQVELLELAASELATNAVQHGGGSGTVALWTEPGAVVLEVRDDGPGTDPLAGRRPPGPDGAAGLYLLHQLCDLLQLRTSADGTTVRVTTWR
jgi:anti-sigma regulatory factor (Ser/Thr protein kinase)